MRFCAASQFANSVVQKSRRIKKNNLQMGSLCGQGFLEAFGISYFASHDGRAGVEEQRFGLEVQL